MVEKVKETKSKKADEKKELVKKTDKKINKTVKESVSKTEKVVKTVKKTKKKEESKIDALLDFILKCLDKNKAENIITINLKKKSSLADYMVVASGRSQRQVHALVDIISKEVKEHLNVNIAIEGKSKSDWAVLDFGDIIVHVFHPEARDFYKIEELWQD